MAYTKIHAIKATVNKAIDYICNPDKTDEKLWISSYACSPETAAIDFKYTLAHTNQHDENQAYHLVQSFLPGEVSFEEAHRIGQELADRVLEGKYSYVISTHIDKGHIHNHIIFCAADNLEHNKYHDCKKTYYRIRKLSDELCAEHNLSIINPGQQRGKSYKEWQADRDGGSQKNNMRKDINMAIRHASTYEEFLCLIRAKGYEIKGETFEENAPKYIAFRLLEKDIFVRGSARSLGKEYTKERIKERIDEQLKLKAKKKVHLPKKDYANRKLIDTTDEKFQAGSGLKQWADIENLKIATQVYQEVKSITELEQKISMLNETGKSAKQTLLKVESRMKHLSEIIKYAEQYKDTKPYQLRYQKAKDKDLVFRKYESKIILHDGAKRILEQKGLDVKSLNVDRLKTEYQQLISKKANLTNTYQNSNREIKNLSRKLTNLNQYLGKEIIKPQRENDHNL